MIIKRDISEMKCKDLLKLLNEYIDGTIDPKICEEFERHMSGCNPCQVVVDTLKKTITVYKEGKPYEIPVEFKEKLHQAIREKWKQEFNAKR
jgi:anti-sigma factor RsiW